MSYLRKFIDEYPNFPKKGINFKDILPILKNPEIFKNLINDMSNWSIYDNADAIIAIDARGFIFGAAIAFKISKPLILARKVGKLPGILIENEYSLEYGTNTTENMLDQRLVHVPAVSHVNVDWVDTLLI